MIIKQKIKIGVIVILAAMILLNTVQLKDLFALAASSPYENDKLSLYDVGLLYHTRMNDLFNSKLKLLNEGEKGGGTGKTPDGDECPENNYSTYCLAMTASKEYEQFKAALEKRRKIVDLGTGTNLSLQEVTIQAFSKVSEIDRELARSKKALDSALANYNELRIAYPMHLQYTELIKNLTEYNKKLTNLRKEVEKLPGKFIDATTAECK